MVKDDSNNIRPANETDSTLLENAGGESGPEQLSASDPSEAEEQARIIYVELENPLPPETLLTEAQPGDASADTFGSDFAGLRNLLVKRGLVRQEYSFGADSEKLIGQARFLTLHFKSGTDVVSVAQELNERREVIHAIEARRLKPPSSPFGNPLDEPLVRPRLGGVVTTDPITLLDNQWYLFRCHVDQAWALNVSGKQTIVADIDWGFLTSHQEFENRIAFQLNTINGDPAVNGGSSIDHGTAVLGIVGAANNGLGMVGIAFDAELWAVQAGEGALGTLDPTPWLRALQCVTRKDGTNKRKVILLEVQTEFDENIELIPPIREAIRQAIANGIVVCVAAGNGSRDAGHDVHGKPFPSSGPILVGATDYSAKQNPIADTSNHGLRVPIYAPGDEGHDLTCSSDADDRYRNGFGLTSGAAPKVAGTIALMLEANPRLSHFEIKDILRETGTLVTGDFSKVRGTFLNAEAAVAEALRRAKI